LVTIAPAAITALLPMVTPSAIIALMPIQTSFWITVRLLLLKGWAEKFFLKIFDPE